jgi:catechol 2,3-dioxygenase-like lactoylglutathione lyase family enzyme
VVFRVNRFEECVSFYDRLMPELGLQCVHRDEGFVYYVGGRTALAIRPVVAEYSDQRHVEGGPGLDHLCWRMRDRKDVDDVYSVLTSLGA